jgi:hypothetical protein
MMFSNSIQLSANDNILFFFVWISKDNCETVEPAPELVISDIVLDAVKSSYFS